jgi:hypothetical protein
MRKLTKEQKEILDCCAGDKTDVEELSSALIEELEQANNYETLYQDITRYLCDKYFARK